eukprot:6188656-Pleurochrysis_carterae.AAC.1
MKEPFCPPSATRRKFFCHAESSFSSSSSACKASSAKIKGSAARGEEDRVFKTWSAGDVGRRGGAGAAEGIKGETGETGGNCDSQRLEMRAFACTDNRSVVTRLANFAPVSTFGPLHKPT